MLWRKQNKVHPVLLLFQRKKNMSTRQRLCQLDGVPDNCIFLMLRVKKVYYSSNLRTFKGPTILKFYKDPMHKKSEFFFKSPPYPVCSKKTFTTYETYLYRLPYQILWRKKKIFLSGRFDNIAQKSNSRGWKNLNWR